MKALESWRHRYMQAGYASIPLLHNEKAPVVQSWQCLPSPEQWELAPDFPNIGLRAGGPLGHSFIDGDSEDTVSKVEAWLRGKGLSDKVARCDSATPGRMHFYIRTQAPKDFNYVNLSIGAGELRAGPGSYVVASCSKVNGQTYKLKGLNKLQALPLVSWKDLQELIHAEQAVYSFSSSFRPSFQLWQPLPDKFVRLVHFLREAPEGQPIGKYASRSEAEAAVVALCVLNGWSFDQTHQLFLKHKPGHFAQAHPTYFERTWSNVVENIAETPKRQQFEEMYQEAASRPWPGRGGSMERAVYLALVAQCWKHGTDTVTISQRDIAEAVASQHHTVSKVISRLRSQRLVQVASTAGGYAPNSYKVLRGGNTEPLSHINKQEVLANECELWGQAALGRSAGEVYGWLSEEPIGLKKLSRITGRTRKTCRRALQRLRSYLLADQTPGGWVLGSAPLEAVAATWDAATRASRRAFEHKYERVAHREWNRSSETLPVARSEVAKAYET